MSLPIHKRYEIIFLHTHPKGLKLGLAATAKYIGCSKSTVNNWVQRWTETKDLNDKPKSERNRVTTEKQDEKIIELAKKDDDIDIHEIRKEMKKRKLNISDNTI